MKNILIAFTIVIVLGLLFWGGSIASKKPAASSENGAAVASPVQAKRFNGVNVLSAAETFFDFGTISMKNGKVSRMFAVKNTGEQPIVVRKVTTSCMCTEAFIVHGDERTGPFGMPGHGGFVPPANETVLVGETLGIEVVFDPAAHGPAGVGRIERAVFIEDEAGGIQTITIKAMVVP